MTRLTPEFKAALDRHNELRARHGAKPLAWDEKLAASAQEWAARGKFEHSKGGDFGENLGLGHPSARAATESFYSEVRHYDFKKPGFSFETGHFTQLVWEDSKTLGIGKGVARGMPFYVFRYFPPGNVVGRFQDNVDPAAAKKS
jgi:hypothetical protein